MKIKGGEIILEVGLTILIVAPLGIIIGYYVRRRIAEAAIVSAEAAAKKLVDDAEKDAEAKKKEILLEAKEEVHKLRNEQDREAKERRTELQRLERRLVQKEENLDRKVDALEKKEESLERVEAELDKSQARINDLYAKQLAELERVSGLSSEEAKNYLLASVEDEIKHEMAIMIKEVEQQAKEDADKKAREIISLAIQRCAADHVAGSGDRRVGSCDPCEHHPRKG